MFPPRFQNPLWPSILAAALTALFGAELSASDSGPDNEDTPTCEIGFAATTLVAFEEESSLSVDLWRRGNSNITATVAFETKPGTAGAWLDFEPRRFRVVFAPGETSKRLAVRLINDSKHESTETFRLVLARPSPGATVSTSYKATVFLVDTDRPKVAARGRGRLIPPRIFQILPNPPNSSPPATPPIVVPTVPIPHPDLGLELQPLVRPVILPPLPPTPITPSSPASGDGG